MESENSSIFMDTKRLETLVDGIFAIAMTLLVLALAVPDITEPLSNAAVQNSLYSLIPSFYTLVMSFILLALFWSNHHRAFHKIDEMNTPLLWINVIWLLFIVLVPFSASLTGKYGEFPISHIIFNLNMLGIALFLGLNWYYASRKKFIDEKVSPRDITVTIRTNILFIVISLLALSLSFVIPRWSALVYLLIFPLEYWIGKM
ncbi:TMEM175 family protein [uncultured Methanobacterium sp.]|uniref:TMEM175 family protein n=1 Tax=uncultured Methanobacterium sp. TaxID=176306 RepID=UPI002AA5E7C9|nr:TMEM175 family protein [uncultured Methanobacterium sp.]